MRTGLLVTILLVMLLVTLGVLGMYVRDVPLDFAGAGATLPTVR